MAVRLKSSIRVFDVLIQNLDQLSFLIRCSNPILLVRR